MPVITSIKQQKAKNRVNVYLDNKFGFGIDLDNFVKLGLRVEQELSQEKVDEIIKVAEFQKTSDKIINFAMVRPRSTKEFTDWCKRKKVPEALHKNLFDRLKKFDLIDDARFARWWVEQRQSFRPKSKRVLTLELRQKGIDSELIKEILDRSEIDEKAIAAGHLEKKLYRWKHLPPDEAKQKMAQYLARQGFNWDIVKTVIDETLKKD